MCKKLELLTSPTETLVDEVYSVQTVVWSVVRSPDLDPTNLLGVRTISWYNIMALSINGSTDGADGKIDVILRKQNVVRAKQSEVVWENK